MTQTSTNRSKLASRAAEVERLLEAMLDIHQPTLSRPLTVQRQAGMVETWREARQIFYR